MSHNLEDRLSELRLQDTGEPDGFATIEVRSIVDLAAQVAQIVFDDMFVRYSLEAQRARLGPGLAAPLPITSLDGSVESPVFMSEMLAYEGSFQDFSESLDRSIVGREQLRTVIAVTQASGSGKTKLAYAQGAATSIMVLIRVIEQSGGRPGAFETFGDLVEKWAAVRPLLAPADRRLVSISALAAFRLLVTCYVEWVTLVLGAFSTIYRREHPDALLSRDSSMAKALREAALRCLRNGNGDKAVSTLYSALLQSAIDEVSFGTKDGASTTQAPVLVPTLNLAPITARTVHVDALLHRLLWPGASVVVWYDEAQALLDTPAVFMREGDYSNQRNNAEPCDIFYGLTALMPSLLDKHQWLQVVCGPWLELSDRIRLAEFSCIRERVTTVHHAARITIDDMLSSLRRIFGPSVVLPDETMMQLARFCGRPKWFFDNFWPAMWLELRSGWDNSSIDACAALPSLVAAAARRALFDAEAVAKRVLGKCLEQREEIADGSSPSIASLCKELYIAIKLYGGRATLSRDDVASKAIRMGVLALDPMLLPGGCAVRLSDEPLIANAIENAGDYLVRKSLGTDPVYQRLTACLRSGAAMFSHIDNVKGPSLVLFTWHVLRTVLVSRGSATLADVLEPFSMPGYPLPDVADARVTAKRACSPSNLALLGGGATIAASLPCPDFALFSQEDDASDVVLFDVDKAAGSDVLFRVKRLDSPSHTLVLVQVKAEKAPRLVHCLRAATLGWQYVEQPQREAVVSGSWEGRSGTPISITPTSKRAAFRELVAAHPLAFEHPIRVVLTVTPYSDQSQTKARDLNEDYEARYSSPLILCSLAYAKDLILPPQLRDALLDSCRNADGQLQLAAHPSNDVWWYPYSVDAIDTAIRERGRLRYES
jgi:hypothetical protein